MRRAIACKKRLFEEPGTEITQRFRTRKEPWSPHFSRALMSTAPQNDSVTIDIGGMAIALHNQSADFRDLLTSRYAGFIRPEAHPQLELAVDLFEPGSFADADDDVTVKRHGREWEIRRGDFSARWDLDAGSGSVRQSANPYATHCALRTALSSPGKADFLCMAPVLFATNAHFFLQACRAREKLPFPVWRLRMPPC